MLYKDEDIKAAQDMSMTYGNPVSPALGQFCLESACGRFEPPNSFNGLGIQTLPGYPSVQSPSHEVINGKLVPLMENFAKFSSVREMFMAYGKLVSTGAPYRGAMVYASNPDAFVDHLGKYSTTPNYTGILKGVMKRDNLYQYDVVRKTPLVTVQGGEFTMVGLMSSVRILQVALNKLGCDPVLFVDGLYGEHTEDAVKWFQGSHGGLDVDGLPGALTCAAILDVFAKHS